MVKARPSIQYRTHIEAINRCKVLPDKQGVNTDHFPIVIEMDLAVAVMQKVAVRNFRDVSWNDFRNKLKEKLAQWGVPNYIRTQGELDKTLIC